MKFDEIAYPLPERWIEVAGARICYVVREAAAGADRPVLLIPPLGRGLMQYRLNLDSLATIGPVVAFDPPGCGKSSMSGPALELVDLAGHTRVAAAVADAARQRGEVPDAPGLIIGTSFGALVALALTETRPSLAHALALSDAAGARPGFVGRVFTSLMSREWVMNRMGRGAWRRALERMFARPDHPALAANLELAMRLRSGPDWPDYLRALARTTRAAQSMRPDGLIDAVRARNTPVLVIWGAHDRVTPLAWGRELSVRLNATLEVITDAGHFPNIESSAAFEQAVLRFWSAAA